MALLRAIRVAQRVSDILNYSTRAAPIGNSGDLEVRLEGLERPAGFSVTVSAKLSVVRSTLRLDSLAGSLLTTIAAADVESWMNLIRLLPYWAKLGIKLDVVVNGTSLEDAAPEGLQSISIIGRIADLKNDVNESAANLVAASIGALLSLLPIDNSGGDESATLSEYSIEGERHLITSTRYERSRANRAIAIMAHGTSCVVCGVNFETKYGDIGRGYIEIHHLTPVHLMRDARVVNPLEELVPLCSNCHRMVHRVDPPYSPDYLRRVVSAAETAQNTVENRDDSK